MPARLSSLSLALALALLAAAGAPPTVAQQLAPPLEFAAPPPASNGGVLLPLASAPAEESPFGVAALAPSESAVGLEAPQAGSAAAPAGPAPAEAGPDLIWGETGQGASSEQDLLTAAAAGLAAGAGAGAGAPLPEGAAAPTAPLRSNFCKRPLYKQLFVMTSGTLRRLLTTGSSFLPMQPA